jgi:hypothetical protein
MEWADTVYLQGLRLWMVLRKLEGQFDEELQQERM